MISTDSHTRRNLILRAPAPSNQTLARFLIWIRAVTLQAYVRIMFQSLDLYTSILDTHIHRYIYLNRYLNPLVYTTFTFSQRPQNNDIFFDFRLFKLLKIIAFEDSIIFNKIINL